MTDLGKRLSEHKAKKTSALAMTDTRDKLPSRPSSIGQAHRIIVQLKARVDYLNTINHNQCGTVTRLQARIDELESRIALALTHLALPMKPRVNAAIETLQEPKSEEQNFNPQDNRRYFPQEPKS